MSLVLWDVVGTFMSKLGSFSIDVVCVALMSISRPEYCVDVLTGTSGTVVSPAAQLESIENVGGASALQLDDVDGDVKL